MRKLSSEYSMKQADPGSDPIDRHLSHLLKAWVSSIALPRHGREALLQRAAGPMSLAAPARPRGLQVLLRWVLYTIILMPVDMPLQPVLYLPAGDAGLTSWRPQAAPLPERFLVQGTASLGVGLFSFIF